MVAAVLLAGVPAPMLSQPPAQQAYHWSLSSPILSPAVRGDDPCYSVKDPSIVRFGGKWHLFTTIRSKVRSHQIEYVSFDRWEDADSSPRHVLNCREGYFCAPQVFYFR